ncbi:P-loop containing nucleoside triphosphate hydrolase protein [Dunaliella salina]|uniref:P-loop containing nucleoside triphosphate hydrolase protein n=1 Tax=Dunaliella salina TaxID=3046 RepID=A0ABQ7GZC1_DUNSA|nr:P-loop containing nucleoside triphosphate hydrolase protein [Dunaliella salina]|eukprot:KAF5839957.1 P-loop containing nucleoside triphosphate hydrolase protein [Dunaliella salina]
MVVCTSSPELPVNSHSPVLLELEWLISVTFKNQQVLTNCSWEVKKGERVGLVGVNGAGKTTQLQIIQGKVQQDAGEVIKAKRNMKIAYLAQEFDVDPKRTVREEFYQVYDQQVRAVKRQEELSAQLEGAGEDMARMQAILDELDKLNNKVMDMDVELLDKKIDQMMPELGFRPEDNDRLVASYSGGWQMRMCLGKMLLQVEQEQSQVQLLAAKVCKLPANSKSWINAECKSTLLRLIMGKEQPQSGSVRMGEYNIVPNYFEQNQAEALDPNLTVLNTLIQSAPDAQLSDLKTLLGRMLFSGPAVDKKVYRPGHFSLMRMCKEACLALADFSLPPGCRGTHRKLPLTKKPTNHLDIPSKEMLEEAIQAFEGSVIAVSHDRYFLRKIATRILLVRGNFICLIVHH